MGFIEIKSYPESVHHACEMVLDIANVGREIEYDDAEFIAIFTLKELCILIAFVYGLDFIQVANDMNDELRCLKGGE